MTAGAAIEGVIGALTDMGLPERAAKSEYYAPTSMKVLGVSVPDLRALISALKHRYSSWNEKEWIAFCKGLVATGIFECQGMAFELIAGNKKILRAVGYEDLEKLGKNLDNWGSVDGYGVGVFGLLWREGVVKDTDIRRLLRSADPWERRLAVVSTVPLNLRSRGGTGDTRRTLLVCERVVDDPHDMVRKALSWALRELSKRDPEAVQRFMERYHSRLAKRVVREVSHKLDFGTKN
jgi:3-methyladenine DNA glycosylase AlkD